MALRFQVGYVDEPWIDLHLPNAPVDAVALCGQTKVRPTNYNLMNLAIGTIFETGAAADAAQATFASNGAAMGTFTLDRTNNNGTPGNPADDFLEPILYTATWSSYSIDFVAFDSLSSEDALALLEGLGVDDSYQDLQDQCPADYPLAFVPGAHRVTIAPYLISISPDFVAPDTERNISFYSAPNVIEGISSTSAGTLQFYIYDDDEGDPILVPEVNPGDPDGTPADPNVTGIWTPPPGYTRINEVPIVGFTRWPTPGAMYGLINRSSNITKVINGFFSAMETWLTMYIDREGFAHISTEIDMNNNRITNLGEGLAFNDLVTKAQVEAAN